MKHSVVGNSLRVDLSTTPGSGVNLMAGRSGGSTLSTQSSKRDDNPQRLNDHVQPTSFTLETKEN